MAKIRQFNIIHLKKVQKMLSYLAPEEFLSLQKLLFEAPSDILQNLLPLSVRKSPESYISINDNDEVKAFITLEAVPGNRRKWFIKRLFLDKNSYDEGKQLVDYSVAKYGALGADTFCVLIDENDDTSAGLFSKMCGFRLCSREVLWKMNDFNSIETPYAKENFITFKNSDSKMVAEYYNDGIAPHFRFSIEKEPSEFHDGLFKGLMKAWSFKMYIKSNDDNLLAYSEISTLNNKDWIIDLIVTKPNEDEYLNILKSIINMVKNRSIHSNIYVLNRNYMTCAKIYEDILKANNFEKIEIKMLLVKDFYKPVKTEDEIVNPAVIFKEIPRKPAFNTANSLQKSN